MTDPDDCTTSDINHDSCKVCASGFYRNSESNFIAANSVDSITEKAAPCVT